MRFNTLVRMCNRDVQQFKDPETEKDKNKLIAFSLAHSFVFSSTFLAHNLHCGLTKQRVLAVGWDGTTREQKPYWEHPFP